MGFSRLPWSGWPIPSPGDLPNPEIKSTSPTLQVDSLPAEPQGKPKNTGVGSLSLLQWIFLTQESNWGLLHCRWVLYQLSYAEPIINFREGRCRESGCLDIEERIAGQLLNLGIRIWEEGKQVYSLREYLDPSLGCFGLWPAFLFFLSIFLKDAIQPESKLTRKCEAVL